MKRALWAVPLLLAVSAWFARGAYTYYYTENGASPNWSNWIVETIGGGTLVSQWYSPGWFGGITSSDSNTWGRMTYTSTSASPGEISLTYRVGSLPSNGGSTSVFVAASSDYSLSNPNAGTAYELSLSYTPSGSSYFLYKNSGGSSQWLSWGDVGVAGHDNMTLRVVRSSNGLILAYLDNVRFLMYSDTSFTGGRMAFNVYRMDNTLSDTPLISSVAFGPLDSTPPNAIPSGSIGVSPYLSHVDLQWPTGSDDANGTGVYGYEIYRNGGLVGTTTGTTFSDTTVSPHTTYTYTLAVRDFHGNYAATNFNVTTPAQTTGPFPSTTPDGRRVGVRATGAYWGASGENIDVMSGNLNFTLPLIGAKARSGWGATFNLNYNSQNWRHDSGGNWKFGRDVGYGWGWRLMAGSITPVYSDPYTLSYYLFTDSTGAEYRLDQNSSNVWSSKESVYVYYDATASRLHYRDGSFWYFGCTSALNEADSGVMYPTLMQDSNGNQVIISYQAGTGVGWTNSSARITNIEDVRAIQWNPPSSYAFTYNTDSPPHLTGITSNIGTGENYSFTYLTGQSVDSPFDSQSFGTTAMLRDVTVTANSTYHEFSYNGSGELTQILLPYKGYLAYDYTTTNYPNSLEYREVVHRYLSKDGISSTQYPLSHEASPTANVHQYTQLDDPGGVGSKHWTFATSGLAMGLVTQYQGLQQPGAVPKVQNDYTWTQDAVGNSYIASATTTADPTQSYAAAKKTDQTVDTYGNVTQVKTYDYGNLTTPIRTDNYTYLSYPSLYIFNKITSTPTATIAYDQFGLSSAPGDAYEWVSPGTTYRGNPTTITSPAGTQTIHYDFAGGVLTNNVNGLQSSVTSTNATNYAAPSQITVGSLSTSMSYSSFLGLTNETDPNSASTTIGYDVMARPSSTTSPFGATTTNTYNDTGSPPTVQTNVNGRWTRTTMDGLGRTIKVETGYSTTTVSVAETVYDSCGCSPTGKMVQTALAHAPGATPVWTTYTYDGIGRTLSVTTVGTETTTTTNYLYQGNTVTVTDAVGNWKKYTMNALGQLVQVNEPNPATGPDYVTTYAYDTLGHLTSVNMPRPTGTQTRTFNYGNPPGALLLSATNPENGTVTYTYNSDQTLATKTDAKNQQVQYSYDSYKRVTQIRRGTYNGTFTEDTCQQENYTYDSGTYGQGRLTGLQYQGGFEPVPGQSSCYLAFTESYVYNSPGGITSQSLGVSEPAQNYSPGGNISATVTAGYTYDNEGRITATQYPSSGFGSSWVPGPNVGNTFDSMGRLQKVTDLGASTDIISNATYGPAGQLLTMTAGSYAGINETRSYNSLGQLTQISSCVFYYGTCPTTLNAQYNYSATQNNGKITSQQDLLSGEQITYTYDSLNRLASATGYGWGQSYGYDGFGNLTNQTVTSGTAPALSTTYDPATNRQTGECADANGNVNARAPFCGSYTYDVENRIVSESPVWLGTPTVAYAYKPGNKRVWKGTGYNGPSTPPTTEELTFWSISGQKLVTYSLTQYQPNGPNTLPFLWLTQTATNYYFGGRLIKNSTGYVTPDRLGSIGKYFPYGQERPSATTDGKEKFATYFRDSETGLDYADQRYHQVGMGRFMTPDPSSGSVSPKDPGSWNRYAYTGGDPVNRSDPSGLDWVYDFNSGTWHSSLDFNDECWMNAVGCEQFFGGSVFGSDLGSYGNLLAFNVYQTFIYNAAQPTPVPSCVQSSIISGAQSGGLDISAFQGSFSVQVVGMPNGQGGTTPFGETELNMTGTTADVQALIVEMCGLGFANNGTSANPWCPGNAGSTPLVGSPHSAPDGTPFTGNFRAPGLTDSLQVNTNLATGQIQMDIDNFNPAAGPLGAFLHAVLQVLPNKLSGTDNSYGCPTQ